MFLDKEYYTWFFKLDRNGFCTLNEFEQEFLNESFRLQFEYNIFAVSRENEFLRKMKDKYSTDNAMLSKLNNKAVSSYIKYKLFFINMVFKSMNKNDAVSMAINLIDNETNRKKLMEYRKSDINDIFVFASYLDTESELD